MAHRTMTRRRAILGRIAFYGAVVLVGLPLAFSQVLIGTQRQPTSRAPAGVEEVWLRSEGLRLRGWLLPGSDATRPAALVAHGLGDTLESFVDVGRKLAARGHSVLLLDMRGHGGSEGRYTTLGGREREDVRAGLAFLESRGLAAQGFLLEGHSMGAVAVLRAAADRTDVRAVVVEAPYDDFRSNVAHHAWLLYRIPRWLPLVPTTIAIAELRAGFDADEVDSVAAARRIRAPLLAIVDGADPRMTEAIVRRVFDAHPGPKKLWVAPGAEHTGATFSQGYWPTVLDFLDESGV
jgi:pimeloyl-ACP methyl ester carboxylesterase